MIFADDYFRWDFPTATPVSTDPSLYTSQSLDFDGLRIDDTHQVPLRTTSGLLPTEGLLDNLAGLDEPLTALPLDPGYANEHGDAHLWYHGTVMSPGVWPVTGGENLLTVNPVNESDHWYDTAPMGPRGQVGYNYSRIGGAIRPSDGLWHAFTNGTANRVHIPGSQRTSSQWPNIGELSVTSGRTYFAQGESIPVRFRYQDIDSSPTVNLFVDLDKNPFNGNEQLFRVGISVPQTPLTDPVVIPYKDVNASTAGIANGVYYLCASVTDGQRTRYAYLPNSISINEAPPVQTLQGNHLSVSDRVWSDNGSGGDDDGLIEAGERVSLDIRLRNPSSSIDISDVEAVLYPTGGSGVVVEDSEAFFGAIAQNSSVWNQDSYEIALNFTDAQTCSFSLRVLYTIGSQPYYQVFNFNKSVAAPSDADFAITGVTIDDSPSISDANNGNGIFESGEVVHFRPRIRNIGSAPATDIEVSIQYAGNVFQINPNDVEGYPDLAADASGYPNGSSYYRVTNTRTNYAGGVFADVTVTWDQNPTGKIYTNALNFDIKPAPWLKVWPKEYDFGIVSLGTPVSQELVVSNDGTSPMTISDLVPSHPDLEVNAPSLPMLLSPGESIRVQLSLNTTTMSGTVTRTVQVLSNGRVDDPNSDNVFTLSGAIAGTVPLVQLPNVTGVTSVDLSGNWIVWADSSSGNSDIFAYNIATGEKKQITTNSQPQYRPYIAGTLIAWNDYRDDPVEQDNAHIYAYDLSRPDLGEIVVANSSSDERLIGVDGNLIAFSQTYETLAKPVGTESANNLLVYQYTGNGTSSLRYTTGYTPGSGTADRPSVGYPSYHDFGEGMLVLSAHLWSYNGATGSWSSTDQHAEIINFARGDTSARRLALKARRPSAGADRFLYTARDANSDYQIFQWSEGDGAQQLTSSAYEPGDDVLAGGGVLGSDILVYDYAGSARPGLYVWDRATSVESIILPTQNLSELRVNGYRCAWIDYNTSSGIAYTLFRPAPSEPDLVVSSDTGKYNNDNVTRDNTPTFQGTALPNVVVQLYAEELKVGETTSDASGNWTITSSILADGEYSFTARRNVPGEASLPISVAVDTTPPAIQTHSFELGGSRQEVRLTPSEAIDVVALHNIELSDLDTGQNYPTTDLVYGFSDGNLIFRYRQPAFPDGSLRLRFSSGAVSDLAGNSSVTTQDFRVNVLGGDANRDFTVDSQDFSVLAANYGQRNRGFVGGDFTYDGLVDTQDFNVLAARFGRSLVPPHMARWTGNGHVYELVTDPELWFNARSKAEAKSLWGITGHLATITSLAENQFLFDTFLNRSDMHGPWIGAYQPPGSSEPSGGWRWVTDEPFIFTHWTTSEPDNVGQLNEDVVAIRTAMGAEPGYWSDTVGLVPGGGAVSYLVEYDVPSISADGVPPTDIILSGSDVDENRPSGTLVGAVSGIDPDPGQSETLAFRLVDGFGDNALFRFDNETKQLVTASTFDYESRSSYTIKIVATDDGFPRQSTEQVFTITVRDVNEEPTITSVGVISTAMITSPLLVSFEEIAAAADETDVDGDAVTFRIESILHGTLTKNGLAVVPGVTTLSPGEAVLWKPGTFESGTTDAFAIRAFDGVLASEATVPVRTMVKASNLAIWPTTTGGNGHAYELIMDQEQWFNAKPKAEARTLWGVQGHLATITSLEENQFIYNTFLNRTDLDLPWIGGYQPPGSSEPDGGWRWVTDEPFSFTYWADGQPDNDRWAPPEDVIAMRSARGPYPGHWYDLHGLTPVWSPAVYLVEYDVVDHSPTDITISNSTVPENEPAGTLVGVLAGTDPDTGPDGTLAFSLVEGYGARHLFTLDPQTLELRTTSPYDFESANLYSLKVRVTDGGSPSLSYEEVLSISVQDRNDAPTFSTIQDISGAVPGTPFTLSHAALFAASNATDQDGDQISFRIESLQSGSLNKDGIPVVPGVTFLGAGESIVWTPAAGSWGVLNAFSVVASDGTSYSTTTMPVRIVVGSANMSQWRLEDGGNGHIYELVTDPELWFNARSKAEAKSLWGITGHLATITSLAENQFLFDTFLNRSDMHGPWIGAYQSSTLSEPSGGWRWVTDEPFTFTHWATGEPNNVGQLNEDVVAIRTAMGTDPGYWSDVHGLTAGGGAVSYLVEYDVLPSPGGTVVPVEPRLSAAQEFSSTAQDPFVIGSWKKSDRMRMAQSPIFSSAAMLELHSDKECILN